MTKDCFIQFFVSLHYIRYKYYLYFHFIHPTGKPMMPHFRRYKGIAVDYYGFTLDALKMEHPQLSLN